MSWIKENPFVAVLGGITVVGAGALLFVGSHFSGKYQEAKDRYDTDAADVQKAEKLALYPNAANRDGKRKALNQYRSSLEKLQESFGPYRPADLPKVSPQDFTNQIKESDAKIRDAFKASGAKIPEGFFVGFENYRSALAPENATGILGYQLGAITELFLALGKAAPTELKNVYRPVLEEERGGVFEAKDVVSRPLPIEVTFRGNEKSVREFISALATSEKHYYVIHSIRVANDKLVGPGPADAKFPEVPKPAASPFEGGGFTLPGADSAAPAGEAAAPASEAPAAADNSRILQQVLGNEEVTVFLRLDVLQFLPTKELPKL